MGLFSFLGGRRGSRPAAKAKLGLETLDGRLAPATLSTGVLVSGGGVPGISAKIAPLTVSLSGGGVPGVSLSGGGVPGSSLSGGGVPGSSLSGGGVPG